MNKKIKTITFQRAHNYGAVLQAYALQDKIEKMGYNCQIVDYMDNNIINHYKPFYIKNLGIKAKIKTIIRNIIYYKKLTKRYNKFNNFIDKNLKLTEPINNVNDMEKAINEDDDVFIAGSDQIWNKQIVGELSDMYTLNFGSSKLKKISYAASVGNNENILNNKDEYMKKINQIDYISVREEDTKKELDKIVKKDINVVLDPTLLLTKEDWNEKISNIKDENEKYIFAYVVKGDDEYKKIVNYLSEKTGLKIIHCELRNRGYIKELKTAYSDGPLEFINYIKNAEYVVATSFHAAVFSILFHKKFFIIPHRTTGGRVTNLLEKLNIKNRVYYNLEEFKNRDYNFETNWNSVENKLVQEREKSISWLKNAIEG